MLSRLLYQPKKLIWNASYDLNWCDNLTQGGGHSSLVCYTVQDPAMLDQIMDAAQQTTTVQSLHGNVKVGLRNRVHKMMIKNNAHAYTQIECWLAYPKRDIPLKTDQDGAALPFLNLPNCQALAAGLFDDAGDTTTTGGVRRPIIGDYSVTPYMISWLRQGYKIKPIGRRVLKGGDQWDVNIRAKSQVFSRSEYAFCKTTVATNQQFRDIYSHMRLSGPLLIVKASGTPSPDSNAFATQMDNKGMNTNTSSYMINITSERRCNYEILLPQQVSAISFMNTPFQDNLPIVRPFVPSDDMMSVIQSTTTGPI